MMLHHFQNAFLVCIDPAFPIRSKDRTPQLQNRHLSFLIPRTSSMPDPLELVFHRVKADLEYKYWKH